MAWSYLPHTAADRQAMLTAIGVESVEELFSDIPGGLRLKRALALPAAMAESELARHMRELADKNADMQDYTCFLGAGTYDHFIPSVIDHVIRRSEFYTTYTQYQPEISQGYLQALWEYQSMICEITGMEVANSSMYDGGTAVAEAAMLACAASGRNVVVMPQTIHPHYRAVCQSYFGDRGCGLKSVGIGDGLTDLAGLEEAVEKTTAAIVIQSPNFFGGVEDLMNIAQIAHAQGALLIAVVDPLSLGVIEAPGLLGADIVVGEGQALGIAPSFGGPYLGFFATTEKLMRKMPGRIVGETNDFEGNRGFVLTLQAREQHIRREKATSNICSNEALCALTSAIYLSSVGKEGFRQVAELSLQKAHYAQQKLTKITGCEQVFTAPFFKEFAVRLGKPVALVNKALFQEGIIGGLNLGRFYPELANCMLFCVTENRSKADIDRLVSKMGEIL